MGLFKPLAFILLINLSSCYVLKQGWHQSGVLLSAASIDEINEDSRLDSKQIQKFKELEHVLKFAEEHGLSVGDAYSEYIYQDTPYVSFLVQAAYPDKLESVTWWFPIVGSVPYLGFFDKDDRDGEAEELADQGFDIHKGYAAAFSGLGYFDDPVFTSMLNRSRPSMAHLFFHELTHRTLWLPGSVRFNENLAEFVGEYLTERYLEGSKDEYEEYLLRRSDDRLYRSWLRKLKESLKKLYAEYDLRQASKEQKKKEADMLKRKELIFKQFTSEKLPNFESDRYNWVAKRKWNNAAVMASSLYSPETEKFREAFDCVSPRTLSNYFKELERAIEGGHSGLSILKVLCERNG